MHIPIIEANKTFISLLVKGLFVIELTKITNKTSTKNVLLKNLELVNDNNGEKSKDINSIIPTNPYLQVCNIYSLSGNKFLS